MQIPQVYVHLARGLIAKRGILLQRLSDDSFEFVWHAVVESRECLGLVMDYSINHGRCALPGEGQLRGDHFISHNSEREDVRAVVYLLPERLLRRHV